MKKILSMLLILSMLMTSFVTLGVSASETVAEAVTPTLLGVTKDYALVSTSRALTDGDSVTLNGTVLSFGDNLSSEDGVYEYKIPFGNNVLQNGVSAQLSFNDLVGYNLTLNSLLEDDFSTDKGWQNATVDTAAGTLTVSGTNKAYLNGNGTDAPSFEQQKTWSDYVLEVTVPASVDDSRMYFYKYATATSSTNSLLYVARNYSGKYICGVSTSGVVSSLYNTNTLGPIKLGNSTTITNGYMKMFGTTSPWTNGADIVFYEGGDYKYADINGQNIICTSHEINCSQAGGIMLSNQSGSYSTTVNKLYAYTISSEIVNLSSDPVTLGKAERLTKDYVYLTFNKKLENGNFKIDETATTAEIVEHDFDKVVYKVKIPSGFLDGMNHYIFADGNEVYRFKLTEIYSDDFSTNKGWQGATVDTSAGTLTINGDANAYPTSVDMTSETDYILDVDVHSSTPTNARMYFRKYTPDNTPSNSLTYILRNFNTNYLVAAATKDIEKSANLFNQSYLSGPYGTVNTYKTGYMMTIGSTNPWSNGVNAKCYEADSKTCMDLAGEQIFATDVVTSSTSAGGINFSNYDANYSMVLDSVNVYKAKGNIMTAESAELISIYAANEDYIEATFSSELLNYSDRICIDGEDVTPESYYKKSTDNKYVYRIDVSNYTDGEKHVVECKGNLYLFAYEELLNDSFDAQENPGWKNATYNGDGTLTVEKKNIAYLDGDGTTAPSFAQQQNWQNYVLEVKVNNGTPKASRMYFTKYATTATQQRNALSYAVRDYSNGVKYLAAIAYYGAITAAETYSSILTGSVGAEYEQDNEYAIVLGTACPWLQTTGSETGVELEMYEVGSEYRLDVASETIAKTSIIKGNSTAGAVAFSNFENVDGKKMILDSIRVYKVSLEEMGDYNIVKITAESDGTTADVEVSVHNKEETHLMIIALYNVTGDIVGIKIINAQIADTDIVTAEDIPVKEKPAYTKVFLWDSIENLRPLCEAAFKSF